MKSEMYRGFRLLVAVIFVGFTLLAPVACDDDDHDSNKIHMTNEELTALVKEAYIYSFPVYEMYRTRYLSVYDQENPTRQDLNQFFHFRQLFDHTDRYVTTPNNDTLYSNAWLDLSKEPVILSVPDTNGRYYVMPLMDFYTNVFASVGTRTTGTQAGSYVIVGPDWDGETPASFPVINSPTNAVWLMGRTLVEGEADLANVHWIQDQYELTPLSVWEGTGDARVRTNLDQPPPKPDPQDPWNFFEIVNLGLTENPPPSEEGPLMHEFAKIGVGPGRTFNPLRFSEEQQEIVLTAMQEARQTDIYRELDRIGNFQGWTYPPLDLGNYGTQYYFRALVALIGLAALPPEEAYYFTGMADKEGNPYDSENRYLLRFENEELPKVDAFWSLTMYEVTADGRNYFTENPINRYSIGDRTEGLKYNSDGSLEIYIQRESPGQDLESNWLPAPASGPFRMFLRTYLPGEPILSGEYRVPGVERRSP